MQTLQSCHWTPHSFHRMHVHLSEYLLRGKKGNFLFIQILMIMAVAPKSLLSMRSVQRLCREKESLERKFLPINPNYPSNSYYKIGTVLLREKYPQEISNSTRSAKVLIVYISVILTTVIFSLWIVLDPLSSSDALWEERGGISTFCLS